MSEVSHLSRKTPFIALILHLYCVDRLELKYAEINHYTKDYTFRNVSTT